MRKRRQSRNPLFGKRWFADDVIITCVRVSKFRLSYRDLSCLAAELGIAVAPSTILRCVVRYAEEFARRWEQFELTLGRSWRADETILRLTADGCTCTAPWTNAAGPSLRI
jgi:transposase-like protein